MMNAPGGSDSTAGGRSPSFDERDPYAQKSRDAIPRAEDATGPIKSDRISLPDLLMDYDRVVQDSLDEALNSTTGVEKVRRLSQTRRLIAVHDAVLESGLCPLLDELPDGPLISERLRNGCRTRAELSRRFHALTKGVAAPNVYPASANEIDEILDHLQLSFGEHLHDETLEVSNALVAAGNSIDPDVVAARMALVATQAPTATHSALVKHPRSNLRRSIYRRLDQLGDWQRTHHGWLDPDARSPRDLQVRALRKSAAGASPTIRDVLVGYDSTVEALIVTWRRANDALETINAAREVSVAITLHDSVLSAVLCPLLEAVDAGVIPASQLREGCNQRTALQHQWQTFLDSGNPQDEYNRNGRDIMNDLVKSFSAHELVETSVVSELLRDMPDSIYRTKATIFADMMTPWRNEGPEVLALRMALWANSSPVHVHRLLDSHPTSRVLRSCYHVVDSWTDRRSKGART